MIKKILTFILFALPFIGKSQDTVKQYNLTDVQVVGIRTDKREPVTITTINTDSIAQFVSRRKDPFFVLEKLVPSVYAQSDNGQSNGYSYMRMRGLDQTRINFNLNGVPLNEMEDQGIYFSNMPGFYNYISSISVERGIGTSKYGNTSVAGSVNMETYGMGQKFLDVNTLLCTQSFKRTGSTLNSLQNWDVQNITGNKFTNFMYSSGIDSNGFAVQLGGTYISNVGFKEHSANDGGSVYYSLGYFKKNNIFKIWGFSGMTHNQLAYMGVDRPTIDSEYKYNANMTSDKDTFNQNLSCISWINYKNPRATFNTTAYFENVNGHYSAFQTLFGVKSYQFGLMSNMVYRFKENYINIGVNTNIYQRTHTGSDSNGLFYGSFSPYTNTGYKQDGIVYLKGVDISGNFNVFYDAQIRLVHFNTTDGYQKDWIFFNPKIGIKYFAKNNETYFSFGVTHREPTRSDMIQQIIQTNHISGNSDNTILCKYPDSLNLRPEIVTDIEIGNNYHIKNLQINSNVYFMSIQNEFVATGNMDVFSGLMQKEQKTLSVRYGIEESIQLKMNNLLLYWNMNIQESRLPNDSMTTIPFCPTFIGGMGCSYKLGKFNIGITEQYVSSMYMSLSDQTVKSSPYSVTNGFINWMYKNTTTSIKFDNLFGNKYYIPAMMSGGVPTFYVGQTFNWCLNFNIRF